MIIVEKPDIMMLQETKCATEDMENLLPCCWKQEKGIYMVATGTTEGLSLLWNPSSVTLEKKNHN